MFWGSQSTGQPTWQKLRNWFLGFLILSGLILVVTHVGELEHFIALIRRAEPVWLALVMLLQLPTYISVAAVGHLSLRSAGMRCSFLSLIPLGIAKLFSDQAVPSGGMAGTAFFIAALNRRGIPCHVCMAMLLLSLVAYLWRLSPCRAGNPPAVVFLSCHPCLDRTGGHCFFVGRGRRIMAARPGAKETSAITLADAQPEQADASHRECTARIIAQPGIDSGYHLAACVCICTGCSNLMDHVAGCEYATVVLGGASVIRAGFHGGDDRPDSSGTGQF